MPEAAMKPDQERVKNLLTDTVTLLCKNGLTFSNKLRIEGLLGVSIDDKDVFFVHISENFLQSPPEGASEDSTVFTEPESPAKNCRPPRQTPSPSQSDSPVTLVKPEPAEDPDDLLIVEQPKQEVLEHTRPAGRRRSHPSWDAGGSAPKRHLVADDDEDGGGYGDQAQWPDLSGVGGDLDQAHMYQQDPDGAGFDTAAPGCSSWPVPLAAHTQPQDSDAAQTRKLPGLKLRSTQIRNALSECLIEPLLGQGDLTYLGFRLMWTNKNRQAEEVWNHISSHQQQVCDQLKAIPGTVFFISSITATVTMTTKVVHPGIAFWVGVDTRVVQEYQIYTTLRNNSLGAEVKIITHRTAVNELERQVNAVSMAIKDYGPGYVEAKVCLPETYLRERFYMRAAPGGAAYPAIIQNARFTLAQLGLVFHLEMY